MEPVRIFKALADETRFKLVKLLLNHDLCVGALAKQLSISEAAVSQHLKSLREAGLVRGEKRGYWTHYAVEKEMLQELGEFLGGLASQEPRPEIVSIARLNGKIAYPQEEKKKR
jgi:DNA-binding transcriptional ArsR family regulator